MGNTPHKTQPGPGSGASDSLRRPLQNRFQEYRAQLRLQGRLGNLHVTHRPRRIRNLSRRRPMVAPHVYAFARLRASRAPSEKKPPSSPPNAARIPQSAPLRHRGVRPLDMTRAPIDRNTRTHPTRKKLARLNPTGTNPRIEAAANNRWPAGTGGWNALCRRGPLPDAGRRSSGGALERPWPKGAQIRGCGSLLDVDKHSRIWAGRPTA
jgi:hypothetical protein